MGKYPAAGSDPYVYLSSDVLRNKLGIRDQVALDRAEATFAAIRAYELASAPPPEKFDLKHLQAVHKHLFGDLYDWAGKFRTVDISKGESRFAHFGQIENYGAQIFRELAKEGYLRDLSADQFAERAAHYLGELNALHPFREGNGRTTREFIGGLAQQAGYSIEWTGIERDAWVQASIESFHGQNQLLAVLVRDNLRNAELDRVLALAKTVAGENVLVKWAEPGNAFRGQVMGTTDRYVIQRQTDGGALIVHSKKVLAGRMPMVGEDIEIRYLHGRAGLVRQRGVKGV